MKEIFFSALLLFFFNGSPAQEIQHKIVFDFTKGDTASFASMMRQAKNMCNMAAVKMEIVCHGSGIDMITKNKSTVQKEIEELQQKYNVVFAVCEATMKRKGIEKNQLVPQIVVVPLANLEFSSKQQEGWSYIKAGQ